HLVPAAGYQTRSEKRKSFSAQQGPETCRFNSLEPFPVTSDADRQHRETYFEPRRAAGRNKPQRPLSTANNLSAGLLHSKTIGSAARALPRVVWIRAAIRRDRPKKFSSGSGPRSS